MAVIFHITERVDWERAVAAGHYVAESLGTEGFIHCSTAEQTVDTANLYYRGQSGLVLLCIDEEKAEAEVKYEPPAGGAAHDPGVGALFPHLYGRLNLDAVSRVVDFPVGEDNLFLFPREAQGLVG